MICCSEVRKRREPQRRQDGQRGEREESQASVVFCKPERGHFLRERSDTIGQVPPGRRVRRGRGSDLELSRLSTTTWPHALQPRFTSQAHYPYIPFNTYITFCVISLFFYL